MTSVRCREKSRSEILTGDHSGRVARLRAARLTLVVRPDQRFWSDMLSPAEVLVC